MVKKFKYILYIAILTSVFFSGCFKMPISTFDRKIVVSAENFRELGYVYKKPNPKEKLKKVRYLDSAIEVDYEFLSQDGDKQPLYISNTISFEPSESSARSTYKIEKMGATVLKMRNFSFEDVPSFFRYGDECRNQLITSNGQYVGNFFVFRKGQTVFSLFIVGIYFKDQSLWESFLTPVIKNLELESKKIYR